MSSARDELLSAAPPTSTPVPDSHPTGSPTLVEREEAERALADGATVLQDVMERFHALVGLGTAITDMRGRVLVAVGWQDICTRFHRVHPETCRNCVESDTVLARRVTPGEYAVYRCKNNMWDVATPIVAAGHHVANVYFGQFFFEDEPPDASVFEEQAARYGFDRTEYLRALGRVPRVGRDRVRALMEFYVRIARLATEFTSQRLTIRATERARAVAEQEERVLRMFDEASLGIFRTSAGGSVVHASSAAARLFGYDSGAELCAAVQQVDELFAEPGEPARLLARVGPSGVVRAEAEFRRRDGDVFVGEVRLRAAPGAVGPGVEIEGFLEDVTERRRALVVDRVRSRLLELAAGHSFGDLLQATLDELELATGSSIGFFHLLEPDQETLRLQTWSTRTRAEFCRAEAYGRHYPLSQAGVWADAVRQRRPVVHNDYAALADRRGMPAGHAPVHRELVVPVIRERGIVAVLGVGNKARDYTRIDVDTVARVADCIWDIAERKRAEERMAAERQERLVRDARLEGLQARVNEIELVLRLDGSVYGANDRALAAYGYSRQEMMRLAITDLRAPETRPEVAGQVARIVHDGDTRFETIHVRKDGSRFPVEVSCRKFTAGGETLLHSLVRDLTEQRQREEQLRLNAALVSYMQEAVISIGLDLRVRSWAGAAEAMYGFTAAEALGRPFTALVLPDATAADEAAFAARLAASDAQRLEMRHRRKSGSILFVDASIAVLRAPDGSVAGYLAVVRDVTEQKHAERELRRSEERLRLALAAGAHVTWEWDVERDRFTHGVGWRELEEAAPGEIPQTLAGWRSLVHPDDLAPASQALQDCVSGATEEYDSKYRIRRRSGGWRWIRSHGAAARRDASGRAACVIGTHTDITETEELNRRLLEATRLASVGTLASGVAHEINNPLSYVRSNLGAALELVHATRPGAEDAGSVELRALLDEALQGADRIGGIVKAMRSLGRPERPGERADVDVRGELLSAIQMVRNQLAHRARVSLEIPDTLPWVRSRTNELGRVFLNLLVNASQALPEANVEDNRIDVAARARDGEVIVEIADSGCGFTDEVRARMFEPFFTTKAGGGTGLGLTMAKAIVDDAGGRIEVERRAPRGALFRVVLPVTRRAEPAPAPASAPASRVRRRVLVIDDEPLVRRSLERIIRRYHDVVGVASGTEAMALLDGDRRWDAILCDLMMPGMDGVALYESLATGHRSALAHLAFITGGAFGERATEFLASHAVAVLPKPFEENGVLDTIELLSGAA